MLMRKVNEILSRGGWFAAPWLLARSGLRLMARKIRVLKFRYIHGIKVGKGVFLGAGIRFVKPRNLQIDDGGALAEGVSLWSESESGRLFVGSRAQVNRNAQLDFSGDLIIERNALISAEAIIYTHDHGHDPRSEPSFSPLRIREGAWVGVRAIILPSVNYIGANAVIGAGAVVTNDVPDGTVFVGAKGRLIQTSDDATQ